MSVNFIVVALRWGGELPEALVLAEQVRGAMERAAVSGARLVGVGADGATFAFDDAALEEAVELALAYVDHGGPLARRWRVGIATGDLAAVRDDEVDPFERFSVGVGALRAVALARAAAPGEVLVDATIREASEGSLFGTGRRVATLGDDAGKRLRGLVLDLQEPWRRGSSTAVSRIHEARLVGREGSLAMIDAVEPGGLAIVRAAAGVGGSRFLEELAVRARRAIVIEPALCSVEPLGALRLALVRARETRPRELGARVRDHLDAIELGRGIDVEAASDLVREWLAGERDERAWVVIDDATHVDHATLEVIGHAASVPDAAFAVVARLDIGDVVPQPLASLVVEADLTLKPLQPHESTAVLEEVCGGKSHVSPEVVRRWTRRGGGVPLAILESVRHGVAVGDLAVRTTMGVATIVARSKSSGRGRALSAHAWASRRLAMLDTDRQDDGLVAATIAIAGAGLPLRVLEEASVDLGVSTPLAEVLPRLVQDALVEIRAELLSPTSRTLREAAIERLDDGVRRRIHAALAAALAREAHGLDLAEGAHHAALAGDHLGAASLGTRAADRARKAGLDPWAASLAAFARAEGASPAPMPTTPSPPPRPSRRSPQPPTPAEPEAEADSGPTEEVPHEEEERATSEQDVVAVSLPPDALELELEDAIEEDEPSPSTLRTARDPVPLAPKAPPLPQRPAARVEFVDESPAPSERIVPSRPSLGVTHLTTGQIAALPAPYMPPPDLATLGLDPSSRLSSGRHEVAKPVSPRAPEGAAEEDSVAESTRRREGLSELSDAARKALRAADFVGLEAALSAIEVVGGTTAAVLRLRAIAALGQGRTADGVQLARTAQQAQQSDDARARTDLALSIALGVAGDRDSALLAAATAMAAERKRRNDTAAEACRRVLAILLSADILEEAPV